MTIKYFLWMSKQDRFFKNCNSIYLIVTVMDVDFHCLWSAGATMTTPSTGNGVEEIKPNPGSGNKHQHNGLRRINTCMYIIYYCCLILAHALTIVLLGLIRYCQSWLD